MFGNLPEGSYTIDAHLLEGYDATTINWETTTQIPITSYSHTESDWLLDAIDSIAMLLYVDDWECWWYLLGVDCIG